jgi:1-pyrroline-5-carboxylate dehydrogenase
VAEKLTIDLRGRVKLEDAGFDWKILGERAVYLCHACSDHEIEDGSGAPGPDVLDEAYVAWQSDQDAYAFSGQKCSAQSILFIHENWMEAGIIDRCAAEPRCSHHRKPPPPTNTPDQLVRSPFVVV